MLYYAPVIFGKLGLSSNSVSLLATGVVGIVMFIATIPAVMYVDRWGRKPTLIIGAVGMAICHFIIVSLRNPYLGVTSLVLIQYRPPSQPLTRKIGQLTRVQDGPQSLWSGSLSSTLDTLGVLVLGSSSPKSGPCPIAHTALHWVRAPTGKLSVREIRNLETTVLIHVSRMNNFIVGQVTPDMLNTMTYGTYIFFGMLTFLGALFIYFIVPETKGLTLEEMDILFGSVGVAAKDKERWAEVHNEVGMGELLARMGVSHPSNNEHLEEKLADEKPVVEESERKESH